MEGEQGSKPSLTLGLEETRLQTLSCGFAEGLGQACHLQHSLGWFGTIVYMLSIMF